MPDEAARLPLFDPVAKGDEDNDDTVRLPFHGTAAPQADTAEAPSAPEGSSQLVKAAWPLLAVLARLGSGAIAPRPGQMKASVAAQLRTFEQAALRAGVLPRQVALARYVLCTAIDEAVLTTSWGATSDWRKSSLLALFHGETWGGEKVFVIIDRALEDPRAQGDLLELCHLVMALGFQGRYRRERDGTATADAVRGRLFDALRLRFGEPLPLPTPLPWRTHRRPRMFNYVSVLTVAAMATLLSLSALVWFHWQLNDEAQSVASVLRSVSDTRDTGTRP
jgi:type VI secretion system protein ImpK